MIVIVSLLPWLVVKLPPVVRFVPAFIVIVALFTVGNEAEVINPALLLNILNGTVDICVFLVKVPSTTTKSSVPINVPEALNSLKSKDKAIVLLAA